MGQETNLWQMKIIDYIVVSYFSFFIKLKNKGLEAGLLLLVFPLVQNLISVFCCIQYLFEVDLPSIMSAILVIIIGIVSGFWLLHKLRSFYLNKYEYLCLIYEKAPKFAWIMIPIIHMVFSYIFLFYSMILNV